MSNEPQKTVLDFLNRNGFPFEMRVADIFRKAGFLVNQSEIYIDPQTEKAREIDVVAYYTKWFNGNQFTIEILIECKHSTEPWVVFPSNDEGFENLQSSYFYVSSANAWLDFPYFDLQNESLFCSNKRDVYGVTAVTNKNNKHNESIDNSYKAIQVLLNCIKYKIHQFEASIDKKISFKIYMPIIAVSGLIYEASLSENEIHCEEISECQYIWKESIERVFPKIHIVNEGQLKKLSSKIFSHCELLTMPHNLQRLTRDRVDDE